MPEHKEVVLALLATATGLGAVLLVFQGLLLTIIGNAPLPEATTWTASLAHMLHGYDTILRIAVVFTQTSPGEWLRIWALTVAEKRHR